MTVVERWRRLQWWWHGLPGLVMGRCRVCGSGKDVVQYDPRGLWAYFGRRTWCPAHCPDHDYEYERGAGFMCRHCGEEPPHDWWGYDPE